MFNKFFFATAFILSSGYCAHGASFTTFYCTIDSKPVEGCGAGASPIGIAPATFGGGFPSPQLRPSAVYEALDLTLTGSVNAQTPRGFHYEGGYSYANTMYLPPAPEGDVFYVKAYVAALGEPHSELFASSSASAGLTFGDISMSSTGLGSTGGPYCQHGACRYEGFVPATLTEIDYYGTFSGGATEPVYFDVDRTFGADISVNFNFQLFKADGTTPDVFTPEPTTYALAGLGIALLALWRRVKQAKA